MQASVPPAKTLLMLHNFKLMRPVHPHLTQS
jgi:hypothetical protein